MRPIDADKIPYVEAVKDTLEPSGEFYARREDICAMPTIKPELRWILCSERLPDDGCRILTTIHTPYKGTNVRSGHYYRWLFCNDNGDTWKATDKEVIAWMPLPEPYKKGEKNEIFM